MKLKVIHYHYDISHVDEEIAWEALCKKLKDGRHQHCSHNFRNQSFTDNYEETVEIDTTYIFSDQFNEAGVKDRRLFDWYLQYRLKGKSIKQGYYVEDLTELNELRAKTFTCGYCGKVGSSTFCDKCIGSKYLNKDELYLLRLMPKSIYSAERPQLTKEEELILFPLWEQAQGLGKISREQAKLAKRRQSVANLIPEAKKEGAALLKKAEFIRDAHTWLLDNKYRNLGNTIVYKLPVLSFGWREVIEDKEGLKKLLKDAPFKWEIKDSSY